jgi:hypothetical protein
MRKKLGPFLGAGRKKRGRNLRLFFFLLWAWVGELVFFGFPAVVGAMFFVSAVKVTFLVISSACVGSGGMGVWYCAFPLPCGYSILWALPWGMVVWSSAIQFFDLVFFKNTPHFLCMCSIKFFNFIYGRGYALGQ